MTEEIIELDIMMDEFRIEVNDDLASKDKEIEDLKQEIIKLENNNARLTEYERTHDAKDKEIDHLNVDIANKKETINDMQHKYNMNITKKDDTIKQLTKTIEDFTTVDMTVTMPSSKPSPRPLNPMLPFPLEGSSFRHWNATATDITFGIEIKPSVLTTNMKHYVTRTTTIPQNVDHKNSPTRYTPRKNTQHATGKDDAYNVEENGKRTIHVSIVYTFKFQDDRKDNQIRTLKQNTSPVATGISIIYVTTDQSHRSTEDKSTVTKPFTIKNGTRIRTTHDDITYTDDQHPAHPCITHVADTNTCINTMDVTNVPSRMNVPSTGRITPEL